ncbi:Uncharacterised protein [Serratia fonticola]|uniref:hypothetical protein n=1 Tax=Serratia fonticola TaxID=47917 RepID=UPI00217AF02A|nr:hypothetical protein [Serratia fonticola]CAI0693379.1 Uncharacterised protein [Serratia fonticola]
MEFNWITLLSPIITTVGWLIAYRLAKISSTRTESKGLIDSSITLIDLICEKSSSFYMDKKQPPLAKKQFEKMALSKITFLYKKLELLKNRGIIINESDFSDLHEFVTYNIPAQGVDKLIDEETILKIIKVSSDMNFNLHQKFHEHYPPIKSFLDLRRVL